MSIKSTTHYHGLTVTYLYFPAESSFIEGQGHVEVAGPGVSVLEAEYHSRRGCQQFLSYIENSMFPDSMPVCRDTQYYYESSRAALRHLKHVDPAHATIITDLAQLCIKEIVGEPPTDLLESIGLVVDHG